jgi:hypothetical protein
VMRMGVPPWGDRSAHHGGEVRHPRVSGAPSRTSPIACGRGRCVLTPRRLLRQCGTSSGPRRDRSTHVPFERLCQTSFLTSGAPCVQAARPAGVFSACASASFDSLGIWVSMCVGCGCTRTPPTDGNDARNASGIALDIGRPLPRPGRRGAPRKSRMDRARSPLSPGRVAYGPAVGYGQCR